jgi:uncharacterized sulfatase
LVVFLATTSLHAQSKRNVLLIISDDLCNDLGCYGAQVVTPNIDKLAARGVKFDRNYCQFPLCGPSRCSFMSGLRPDTTGVLQNGLPVRHKLKDVVTLPQLFRNNGYFAARVGKIYHLGIPNEVGKPGPDDPASWDTTFNPPGNEFPTDEDEYNPVPKNGQSFRRVILKGDGRDQHDFQAADEAIRILREKRDKPLFLALGFIRPHVPEVAPRQFFDLYDLNKIQPPIVPADDRQVHPEAAYQTREPDMGMDERGKREAIRSYHACTSFMDAQVGRVIDELDKLGQTENTVIIFMSDHGYVLGQHTSWQKMALFEPVCRVPMIYITPGMEKRGAVARGLTESVDLYPTVAELCGLKGPDGLHGKSLVPLLKDPEQSGKDAAFTQCNRIQRGFVGRSIRTDRYRYTSWNNGDAGEELYDEQADPVEAVNLAKDPKHAETVQQLKKRLAEGYPAS